MNEIQQSFRDRLLAAEKSTPTEKYQRELAKLLERRLSPVQRAIRVSRQRRTRQLIGCLISWLFLRVL